MNVNITDYIPEENFFSKSLQSSISFVLGAKTLKKGRLILFKRAHFCIQFILLTDKGNRETLEIPFPFKTEVKTNENAVYFDYRFLTLANNCKETETVLKDIKIKNISPSQFYDKVLQIHII